MSLEAWAGVATIAIIGALLVFHAGSRTQTLGPALVGYVVRLTFGIITYLSLGLAAPDAEYYDMTALAISTGDDAPVTTGKEGWVAVLSFLYSVYGHSPIIGIVLNCAAGATTITLVAKIASTIGAPARLSAWIWALNPFSILWGSLLLRESIVWLLLAGIALGFTQIAHGIRRPKHIALAVTSLVLLTTFRGTIAIVAGTAAILAVCLVSKHRLTLVSGLTATGLIAFASPLGSRLAEILSTNSIESISTSRSALSSQASTGWPASNRSGLEGILDGITVGAPRVTLGPFPWEWSQVGAALAADAAIWLLILFMTIRGLRNLRSRAIVPLFMAGALLLALMLTSGNYGTMQRLRIQPEMLLIPIAAAGVATRRQGALSNSTFISRTGSGDREHPCRRAGCTIPCP